MPGDEVLYPDPGFPGYASITLGLDAQFLFRLPCPRKIIFSPIRTKFPSLITPRTKAIILNSPGNPTGTVYTDRFSGASPNWP